MALGRGGKRVGGCSLRGRNQAAWWSPCSVLEAIEDSEGPGAGQDHCPQGHSSVTVGAGKAIDFEDSCQEVSPVQPVDGLCSGGQLWRPE